MTKPKRKRPRRYLQEASEMKEVLKDLAATYNLSIEREEDDIYGLWITYQNDVAGIRLEYSPREGVGWNCVIAQLIDGKFPPHPICITKDTNLFRFDLRDLAVEKIDLIPSLSDKIRQLKPLTAPDIAQLLDGCASDILKGDFTVFAALRTRVMERIAEIE